MTWLRKDYAFKIASIMMLVFVISACKDNDDAIIDNSIAGSEGVGVKKFELYIPFISKLCSITDAESVILELQGENDGVTYEIYATSSNSGDNILLSSDDEVVSTLPHQGYYLNFVHFPESSVNGNEVFNNSRSLTLGARLSLEDPNNITLTSSYNAERDCFGSGSSEEDPISVVTVRCLETQILDSLTVATSAVSHKGVYFRQTRSLNFAAEYELFDSWTAAGKFNVNGLDVAFHGVYDGGRNTLEDLSISTESSCALFYRLGDGAVIKNVQMKGVNLAGGVYAGAIACLSSGDVTLENINVHGTISGYGAIGGLIGAGNATFKDCYVNMTLINNNSTDISFSESGVAMGGFIGRAIDGDSTFSTCCYSGTITSDDASCAGGFVGQVASSSRDETSNINVSFVNCAVSGSVGNSDDGYCNYTGGLIGCAYQMSNLFIDNVMIGSSLTVDTDDKEADSIFGNEPKFAESTNLTLTSTRVNTSNSTVKSVGGYIGRLESDETIFMGSNEVTKGCKICGSDYIGGVIGSTGSGIESNIFVKDVVTNLSYLLSTGTTTLASRYIGGFVGFSNYTTIACDSDSMIVNTPSGIILSSSSDKLGSFAGYMTQEGAALSSTVTFINTSTLMPDFISNMDSDLITGSTFINMTE